MCEPAPPTAAGLSTAPKVMKTSSGCGTDGPDISSDDDERFRDEDPGAEDATYTAELIRDAVRDIDLGDNVSAYERRLALREIKCVLRDAYNDRDVQPPARVKDYLIASEHHNTNEQFLLLRAEMLSILRDTEAAETRIQQQCRILKAAWKALGHQPGDMFEMMIWKRGRGLHPSRVTEAALTAMVQAWVHATPAADDFSRGVRTGELRIRIKNLLTACSVPEARALTLCQDPQEGQLLEAALGRLEAALPEYQLLVDAIARLGRDPVATAAAQPTLEAMEEFLEAADKVLKRIKRWQSTSGAPFFISRGEKLRFGIPVEQIADVEPFSIILSRVIQKCAKYVPCKPMGAQW